MNEATPEIATLPANAARMMAVEILLADPEALEDEGLVSRVAWRYRVNATYTTRLLQHVLAKLWKIEGQTWARR